MKSIINKIRYVYKIYLIIIKISFNHIYKLINILFLSIYIYLFIVNIKISILEFFKFIEKYIKSTILFYFYKIKIIFYFSFIITIYFCSHKRVQFIYFMVTECESVKIFFFQNT